MDVNTSSTSLIQCDGTFYEREAFFGALVFTPTPERKGTDALQDREGGV